MSFAVKSSHKFVNPKPELKSEPNNEELEQHQQTYTKPLSGLSVSRNPHKAIPTGMSVKTNNSSVEDFY